MLVCSAVRRASRYCAPLLAVALAFASRSSLAAPPPLPTDTQYVEAQEVYKAGGYAEALTRFRALLAPTNVRLYVARSLRGLGRRPEAYHEMLQTVRDASEKAVSEKRFVPTRDAATDELAELKSHVGRVKVRLPTAPPADLEVTIAGTPVDVAQLNGTEVAVFPRLIRIGPVERWPPLLCVA